MRLPSRVAALANRLQLAPTTQQHLALASHQHQNQHLARHLPWASLLVVLASHRNLEVDPRLVSPLEWVVALLSARLRVWDSRATPLEAHQSRQASDSRHSQAQDQGPSAAHLSQRLDRADSEEQLSQHLEHHRNPHQHLGNRLSH